MKAKLAVAAAGATIALAAGAAPGAAEAAVPWGAGCTSTPPSGQRTSANCGASLVDGRAIAPPGAPSAVKRVIAAANQIDGRPYAGAAATSAGRRAATTAPARSATPCTEPTCSR